MMETNMKQTVMGIEQNIDLNMEMSFNHQVVENTEINGYELISEYRRMFLNINYAFDKVTMDTDRHESSDLLSSMMKKLMNKPFSIFITKYGEITDVSGFESYIPEVLKDVEVEEAVKLMLAEEMNNSMGEELIHQNFSHLFGLYPSKPVKRNEAWEVSYVIDQSGMKLLFSGKGALVDVTPRTFLIRISGIITNTGIENEAYKDELTVTGRQVSEVLIDRTNGWPLRSTVSQEISGILNITDDTESSGSIEIPMQIRMRMNMDSGK